MEKIRLQNRKIRTFGESKIYNEPQITNPKKIDFDEDAYWNNQTHPLDKQWDDGLLKDDMLAYEWQEEKWRKQREDPFFS